MFTVGQKVYCKVRGEGEVTEVMDRRTYPIGVDFLNGEWEDYTVDGRMYKDDAELSLTVIE